jgi:predicted HTH domain antitoxin
MSVHIEFPEEVLVASREDRDVFARNVMLYTLGHLYEQGKISAGFGARVLGTDRWEFYRLLSEHGFAVIDYAHEELEAEAQSSREIAARLGTS